MNQGSRIEVRFGGKGHEYEKATSTAENGFLFTVLNYHGDLSRNFSSSNCRPKLSNRYKKGSH